MNQGPIIHKRIIGRTFLGICQPSYHNFQEKKGCKFHAHLEVFFSLNLMTLTYIVLFFVIVLKSSSFWMSGQILFI